MKRHSLYSFFAIFLFTIFSACETNEAPVFDTVVPDDGYAVEQGEIIEFYFGASDPDGEVDDLGKASETSVQFILDPVRVITPTDVHASSYEERIFIS